MAPGAEFKVQKRWQPIFKKLKVQMFVKGEGVEVVVRKRVKKSSTAIFYIVMKTAFKRYFYDINIKLEF